jgi:hypothetical protein
MADAMRENLRLTKEGLKKYVWLMAKCTDRAL